MLIVHFCVWSWERARSSNNNIDVHCTVFVIDIVGDGGTLWACSFKRKYSLIPVVCLLACLPAILSFFIQLSLTVSLIRTLSYVEMRWFLISSFAVSWIDISKKPNTHRHRHMQQRPKWMNSFAISNFKFILPQMPDMQTVVCIRLLSICIDYCHRVSIIWQPKYRQNVWICFALC